MSTIIQPESLVANLGGSWRNGKGQAPCPICQPERRRDQRALSISFSDGMLLLYCFKQNCSFTEIAETAGLPMKRAQIDLDAAREVEAKQAAYAAAKLASARSLWEAAQPIAGTMAEAYLRARAITCALPDTLRFIPDIHHTPSNSWGSAMVANVEATGGAHRTFFDKQGKRLKKSAKMMLGPCSGGAVHLSSDPGPLVVCEGIETGLSLLCGLLSGPAAIWAALSTSGVKALELPPDPGKLVIAMDGDDAGRQAGNLLAQRAWMQDWQVSLLAGPDGQDWNDVLVENGGAS